MSDTLMAVIAIFFAVGITVGVVTVFAMSALREDRRGRAAPSPEDWPGPHGREPSGPDRTRWPGDLDNDFSDR